MKFSVVGASLAAALLISSPLQAEPLTTTSIIELTKVGLGDEAIVAKIKSEGTVFNLSTDEMIALRGQGVSSAVIAAMLSNKPAALPMSLDSPDPAVPHPAGVYLLQNTGDAARMFRIDPTVSNQAKTGGILGYAFTGGLASASIKVVIQSDQARARSTSSPRFYFFFDEANNPATGSSWASGMNTVVTSPAEFSLIRLAKKEGRREARVGSMNIAGAKTGVMDKDRIGFNHSLVRPGVYQIDLSARLCTFFVTSRSRRGCCLRCG